MQQHQSNAASESTVTAVDVSLSKEERQRQLVQKYERFEQVFKADKDSEVISTLSELAREIEEVATGKLVDTQVIQLLFGNFLPKFFKLLLSKKYYSYEVDKQILVTQFVNLWMKNRVPHIRTYFKRPATEEGSEANLTLDPIYREIGIAKDFEIVEMLFNGESEIYNYRLSKNTAEVEDRLSRIFDQLKPAKDIDGKEAETETIIYDIAQAKRPQYTSYFYVHNINVFNMYHGFDGLLHLLKESNSQISFARNNISMIKVGLSILTILSHMKGHFREDFWSRGFDYGTQIALACFNLIQSQCSADDIRLASKKDIQFFSTNVESILDSVNVGATPEVKIEKVYMLSESIELQLALKCLKSEVLEKKLIGHSILNNQIQKVINGNKQQSQRQGALNMNLQGLLTKKWLNNENLLEWIQSHRIFDIVFGDSLHSEVIKKSYILLEFLYVNEKLQRRELDKMWECATKKHEAYKVAILKALAFLATKSGIQDLKYLFNKLKSIPLTEIDKFCLDLIKSIAKKLVGDESMGANSPKKANRHISIGPILPPNHQFNVPRSNSGDRMTLGGTKKKGTDGRLNNSFSNDTNVHIPPGAVGLSIDTSEFNLDRVALHQSKKVQTKRNNSSPRNLEANEIKDSQDKQVNESKEKKLDIIRRAHQMQENNQQSNQDTNPLEVPPEKEDKNTADEDLSFTGSNQNLLGAGNGNEIFNISMRDDTAPIEGSQQVKSKNINDLEEEKEGADPFSNDNQQEINDNLAELINDVSLGLEDLDKRELAHQILDYLWSLCQESSVSQMGLSIQAHKIAIDDLVHLIQQNYPSSCLYFIGRCVNSLTLHQSVMSVHVILQKLIMSAHFPLSKSNKVLPQNRQEFILSLDQTLSLANICLSSYIEFKRLSLNYIFDQMGSQEHEQENLETQSSLDNDEERSNSTIGQSAVVQDRNALQIHTTPQSVEEGVSGLKKEISSVQDEGVTKTSNGSMFISPRMRSEEEFKIPKNVRTQSFKDEGSIQMNRNVGEADILVEDQQVGTHPLKASNSEFAKPDPIVPRSTPFQHMQFQQTHTAQPSNQNRAHSSQTKRHNVQGNQRQTDGNALQQNLGAQFQNTNQAAQPGQNQVQPNPSQVNRDFLNSLVTNEVYKFSYYEELHHRLDFLKFLVGSNPAILKPQQLQILWECLVINAFYDRERDQFFNWCTQVLKASQSIPSSSRNQQDKDSQVIASESIFNDDCLEMLYFETLLKLDFRYISEVMYECFERYFIYINEQYGQIVTNSAFESNFEVFETKLIGIEALWEILLCARNIKVYKKATEFLHKIYKKMSPELVDRLNEIKEDLLYNCMEQIKAGYHQIRQEMEGSENLHDVPIYHLSQSFEDPKNRIARSISQLCKFIDEFEGLRDKSAKSGLATAEREIQVICNISINQNPNQKKIEFTLPLSTKIGVIREQVAAALYPKRQSKEISLMNKGRDLIEDLKTLKDLGVAQNDKQVIFIVTMRNQFEMDLENQKTDIAQNNEVLNEAVENLKVFMGDFGLPDSVLRLAIQKCNMNSEEAILMLTDEMQINDLQEEIRKQEEANANNNIMMIEEAKEEANLPAEEAKLNLIISNRSEYFDLLFELLNLGINEITNAAWNLLIQIPVNKTLLHQIRTLQLISEGNQRNWCQIIDPQNAYKMLYSIQIVNSLISVNNEKLSEAEIQERFEWRQRFLELGGFEHLYSILITSEPEEFLGLISQATRQIAPSQGKKKQKGVALTSNERRGLNEGEEVGAQKENLEIQNNQAKCLGYLISIVKIFIQAALLTADEDKLLTLIVQSSTSPFRKPKTMKSALQAVPQSKFNQIMFGGASGGSGGALSDSRDEGSRDTSSIMTPKFQSSHSSTPQCQTPTHQEKEQALEKENQGSQMNKSMETVKAETVFSYGALGGANSASGNQNQLYTQVDDFPRLVDQIKGPIAQNILDKVVNFNGLISKLLNIIYKAVMFSESPEVSSLVQNSLDLLLPCIVWRPQLLLKEIYEFENLESLLIRTLLHNSNENVRRSIERTFKIICNENPADSGNAEGSSQVPPRVHILKILLNNLPDIDVRSDYCEEFFNLITYLIKLCQGNFKSGASTQTQQNSEDNVTLVIDNLLDPNRLKNMFFLPDGAFSPLNLLKWCIYQLKARPTYEDRFNQYTDKVLAGYLQLTQSVLEINHNLKKLTRDNSENGNNKQNLVKTIFDFLFLLPSMEDQQQQLMLKRVNSQQAQANDAHPKCKRKLTRKKAFNLLLTLCQQQEDNFVQLLKELYAFHAQVQKSQKVVSLAEFDNEVGLRSSSGYVGLKNFGCTCYMNALIQQLFMVPDVRKGILESDVNDPDIESNELYQMKLIFANLQESEKQYYAPEGFTRAFKFYGEPVNVRVQQDTYEFFGMLFDNLENSVKGTPFEKMLSDTVGGVIGNETRSTEEEYPYIGEREENFYAISLDIKNKKTLQEALDLYIKPDHLEGDNKYFCEKHNRKVDAQRRSYLKKLQNTVIIHLKRFEFDYNNMQRLKVNDYCEFPDKINFKPWTKEGIKERERLLKSNNQENNAPVNADSEEGMALQQRSEDGERRSFASVDAEAFEEGSLGEVEEEKASKQTKKKQKKKAAAPIDEDLESSSNGEEEDAGDMVSDEEDIEDEENMNSMMNTGKYFDEGVMEDFIDIAADEYDELDGSKKAKIANNKGKQQRRPKAASSEIGQQKQVISNEDKPFGPQKNKLRKAQRNKKTDSYYEYQLVGVLVHSGSADAGHYYSFIKERNSTGNGRWLEFNDTHVKEFDIKNLGVECFGGNQEFGGAKGGMSRGLLDDFQPSDARLFERCRNAYLLFYERVEKVVEEHPQSQALLIPQKKLINGIESSVYQRIWDENAAFMKLKIFYDQEYFSFAREYISLYNFENVLSFDPSHSQSAKINSKIELTQQFLQNSVGKDPQEVRAQFIKSQFELDKKPPLAEDNGNKQLNEVKIQEDPGLYAIKFATVLSLDIINKLKDMQSFVQWMQLMDSLYERHDLACVWLIKFFTDNNRIMESLLIETNLFEVRESFAKLLITTIGVTAKNEEKYMFKTDDILVYQGTPQGEGTVERYSVSRSAVCRFMEVLFSPRMLDNVLRFHWRKFDEYFQVLAAYAQIGFSQTKYLIVNQNAIMKLLEFVMNSSPPFTSKKQRMGDGMQAANFTQAVDILSLLICSCFTKGVKLANQYSPYSKYQEEEQHIELNTAVGQFPLFTPECFTQDLLLKANPNSDSLLRMVVHLCWGDLEASAFFIEEVVSSIKNRRCLKDLSVNLKILNSLMSMSDLFQKDRLEQVFQFDKKVKEGQASSAIGGAVARPSAKSILKRLEDIRYTEKEYVIGVLHFFGKIAVQQESSKTILMFMRENKQDFQEWIQAYLLNIMDQVERKQLLQPEADMAFACIDFYKEIIGPSEAKASSSLFLSNTIEAPSSPIDNAKATFGNQNPFTAGDDFITGEDYGLAGASSSLINEEQKQPLLNTSLDFERFDPTSEIAQDGNEIQINMKSNDDDILMKVDQDASKAKQACLKFEDQNNKDFDFE